MKDLGQHSFKFFFLLVIFYCTKGVYLFILLSVTCMVILACWFCKIYDSCKPCYGVYLLLVTVLVWLPCYSLYFVVLPRFLVLMMLIASLCICYEKLLVRIG